MSAEDRVTVRDPDTGYIIVSARDNLGGFASAALTEQETRALIDELETVLEDRRTDQ